MRRRILYVFGQQNCMTCRECTCTAAYCYTEWVGGYEQQTARKYWIIGPALVFLFVHSTTWHIVNRGLQERTGACVEGI